MKVTEGDLQAFRNLYLGRFAWQSRVSDLCVVKMIGYQRVNGLDPIEIIETLKALEGDAVRMTKRPTRYRQLPLKGLWHCHFFAAQFMPANMLAALEGNIFPRIAQDEYADLLASGEQPSEERVEKFVARLMDETLDKRAREHRLTGEWIVYLPRDGQNYYLSVTAHNAGDAETFEEIMKICPVSFPELALWIEELRAET
ncbi:MAG: hypothetical protein ACOH2N_03050 [Devosia sp.]